MIGDLLNRWLNCPALQKSHSRQLIPVFQRIEDCYQEHHRFYHTLTHIQDVLDNLPKFPDDGTLFLAAMYHDMIYVPGAKDNEARSARYFLEEATALQVSTEVQHKVFEIINATNGHHLEDQPRYVKHFIDADLAGLREHWEVYAAQGANIRKEFAHVSDSDYRKGRTAFLHGMLNREKIFSDGYDKFARSNMKKDLELMAAAETDHAPK